MLKNSLSDIEHSNASLYHAVFTKTFREMCMTSRIIKIFLGVCILFCIHFAQASPNPDPGKPMAPFRIAGNLYYIGNTYVASYLIVTSKGNILINSDYEADVPMLKANIEKLGFKYSDTKILLISHAHADHSGGSALIKRQTGAKYMVMDADVSVVESGGKTDFRYGDSTDPDNFYQPTKVDRVLHDGDKVKLGDTILVAHHTGGHTKGCTTWTMNMMDKGKTYHVVIVGGVFVNPGYKLVNNDAYPTIRQDYEHTFKTLKSLPCDIFLGAHGMYYDLDKKYALLDKSDVNPLIDPEGYKKFIAQSEKEFRAKLAEQTN